MSELDLLKLFQSLGEETELADFSPEELQDMLDRMTAGGEELPMTKESFKQ